MELIVFSNLEVFSLSDCDNEIVVLVVDSGGSGGDRVYIWGVGEVRIEE